MELHQQRFSLKRKFNVTVFAIVKKAGTLALTDPTGYQMCWVSNMPETSKTKSNIIIAAQEHRQSTFNVPSSLSAETAS